MSSSQKKNRAASPVIGKAPKPAASKPAKLAVAAPAAPQKGRKAEQKPVAAAKAAAPKKVLAGRKPTKIRVALQPVGVVSRARMNPVIATRGRRAVSHGAIVAMTNDILATIVPVLDKAVLYMEHGNRHSLRHDDVVEGFRVATEKWRTLYSAFGYGADDALGSNDMAVINRRLYKARHSHPVASAGDADE